MYAKITGLCVFLLIASVLISCGRRTTKDETIEREIQQKFSVFAASHNAVTDWKATLPDQDVITAYSIQVKDALIRPDKRPAAFRAYLEDVVRRDGCTFLEFSTSDNLYLSLEATPEIVQQLKEGPSHLFTEYAVIADILSVAKPTLQVVAEKTDTGAAAQLDKPDKFLAKGRCIGLLPL